MKFRVRRGRVAVLGMVVSGLLSASLRAAVTVYTDHASFLEALAVGYFEDDFTSIVSGSVSPAVERSGNGYTLTHTSPGFSVYGTGGKEIGAFTNSGEMLATMSVGTVYAAGANFFFSDVNELFAPGTFSLTLVQHGLTTVRELTPISATTGSFLGFISEFPLLSLQMSAGGAGRFATYDNFTVGVPEPRLGWLAFALWWKRRRLR